MVDIWLLFCIGVIFLIIICHVLVDNAIFNDMMQENISKKRQSKRNKLNKGTFKSVVEKINIRQDKDTEFIENESKLWSLLRRNVNHCGDGKPDDECILKSLNINKNKPSNYWPEQNKNHRTHKCKKNNPKDNTHAKMPRSHEGNIEYTASPNDNNISNTSNLDMGSVEPLNPTFSRRQLLPTDDATSAPWKPSGKQALRASKITILFIVTMFNVFYWGYIVEG